jgi:DNA (cytosine-5)-methyltransferase 1
MISTKSTIYKLPKESLSLVDKSQIKIFEEDFKSKTSKDFIGIKYNQRNYNVNSNSELISKSKINAIGLFSGAGGLDIGTQLAGVKVISSLDFDKDSVATMRANKYFSKTVHLQEDIRNISGKEYKKIIKDNNPDKLILVGGPPCQPFSKAGYWRTHENRLGANDPRNMIGNYLRLISEVKPNGFVLENVESILHPKNINAVDDLVLAIEKLGFYYKICKVNAIEFGIPQKRKRVFIVASKKPFKTELIKTHGSDKEIILNPLLKPYERVIDWIGKYDNILYSDDYDSAEGKYFEDLLAIPPGSNYIALTKRKGYPNPKFVAGKRYWTFLLKLHPLQPSWTIISSPGHWEGPFHWNSRRLRIKEIAAIQTFPEDYHFVGSRRSIQKQIGNAVPPLLGKIIIEYLIKNIQ